MSDKYYIWQSAGCPTCDERHVDELVWTEDGDHVECQNCGTKYRPHKDQEIVQEAV